MVNPQLQGHGSEERHSPLPSPRYCFTSAINQPACTRAQVPYTLSVQSKRCTMYKFTSPLRAVPTSLKQGTNAQELRREGNRGVQEEAAKVAAERA